MIKATCKKYKVIGCGKQDPIAIIGVSGKFPAAQTPDIFWNNLEKGEDCIQEVPRDRWNWREVNASKWGGFIEDIDKFDAKFFNISPREAELLDPQHRLFLESVWQAIEDAGYSPNHLSGTKTGLFVGVSSMDYSQLLDTAGIAVEAYSSTGMAHSVLANRISYLLNISGPSEAIDTACSSSLIAIKKAVESIRNGESEIAIAGGVNALLHPKLHIAFTKAGMLSEDGRCKTFDKKANGYVRGEGVGAILLKPLAKAIEDGDHIYGVIRGVAENHGGRATSLTAPNPNAQAELLVDAYIKAGVDVDTISYIETHGTGTSLGDPIEINGLKKAFAILAKIQGKQLAEKSCGISSAKTNIGHLEAAAGIAGVLKVLLAMKHKKLPGTVHFEEINPYIELKDSPFYIVDKTKSWGRIGNNPLRAGVSSFGFGGANAHIVIEEHENLNLQNRAEELQSQLIILSAKNEERLKEYAKNLSQYLRANKDNLLLQDIAYTLQVGRESMEERLGIIAQNKDGLIDKLDRYIRGEEDKCIFLGNSRKRGNKTTLFEQDEFLQETICKWIEHGRVKKLVELWVDGMDIDWTMLPHENSCRVSLPTYPFARERHWIPENKEISKREEGGVALHPLLDSNESTLTEHKFKKHFIGNEFYLKDHVVLNKNILPGVAYLEMARAAGNFAIEKEINRIYSVVWLKPIDVGSEGKDIKVLLYPQGDEVRYEIVSTNSGNGAATGNIVYSQGKLGVLVNEVKNQTRNIDEIRKRCRREIAKEEVYKLYKARGIEYGEAFQVVESIKTNDKECLGKLILPQKEEVIKELEKYVLHPSIMDGALQSCIGLVGQNTEETYVPFSLSEINIYKVTPAKCYAYIKLVEDKGGTKKYNIELLDEQGQLIVDIKGLEARSIGKKMPKDNGAEVLYYGRMWIENEREQEGELETEGKILLLSDKVEEKEALEKATNYEVIFWGLGKIGGVVDKVKNEGKTLKYLIYNASLKSSEESIYGLLQLLQMLISNKISTLKILYVHDGDDVSGASGLMKTVEQEYPRYKCKVVGIAKNVPKEKRIEIVVNELKIEGKEVRYLEDKRYERNLFEIDPQEIKSTKNPLKKQGVYWITGGAGGLGMIIGKYLAEKYQAKLVLTGRTKENSLIKEKVKQLEAAGANVLYIKGDVSNKKDVKEIVSKINEQFGKINGIIHSAGTIKDSLLINKNLEEAKQVITPKVVGTKNLDEVTKNEKLDFFVMFSSIAGVLGNIGQSDYAYANAFMDRYAEYREELVKDGKRYGKTISIAWPLWKDGGMQVSEGSRKILETAFGIKPLESLSGLQAFEACLQAKMSDVLVVSGIRKKIQDLISKEKIKEIKQVDNCIIKNSVRSQVEQEITNVISEILKVKPEDINIDEDVTAYGFDSITLTELINKLNEDYGLTLTPSFMFDHKTVGSLVAYLFEEEKEALNKKYGDYKNNEVNIQDKKNNNAAEIITDKQSKILINSNGDILKEKSVEEKLQIEDFPMVKDSKGHFFLLGFLKKLLELGLNIKVDGLENIPLTAPFILCSNHSSHLDTVFIFLYLPLKYKQMLTTLSVPKNFNHFFMRHFAKYFRAIPIGTDMEGNTDIIRVGEAILQQNKPLLIYPEGTRSRNGEMGAFKKGVAYLALKTNVPVVPIRIKGTYEILPPEKGKFAKFIDSSYHKRSVSIHFGKPIFPQKGISVDSFNQFLHETISNM